MALLNRGEVPAKISFSFKDVGFAAAGGASPKVKVADVWAGGKPVTTASGSFGFEVAPHAAEVFILSK